MLSLLLMVMLPANVGLVPLSPSYTNGATPTVKNYAPQTEIYHEDFEAGAPGWVSKDLTAFTTWHPDTFQAYDETGKSWWVGDPLIKGYLDSWYQVLDSPTISIPASGSPKLTFMQNRNVEALSGGYPAGYDGWDGCNVRVSTNGGTTWTVIEPTSPVYNSTSMFSFGFEHNEGTGIAGWGGSSSGWVLTTFDLSAYKGMSIKIRWAFASDPAYCTTDDTDLFGWQVDSIDVAGVFTNDGEDTTGFTKKSMVPLGGDLWHITQAPDAPSPTHIASCSNESDTYNKNMEDFYLSPLIHLPQGDLISADFMIRAGFADPDTFPFCDFIYVQLSPDTGRHWYYASNPTGDPTGVNYVYTLDTTDIDSFYLFSQLFAAGYIDVSYYVEKDLLFRIGVHSDDDTPDGIGLRIDDFMVLGEGVIGVKENPGKLPQASILSVSPSPFTNSTTIRYQLPKAGRTALKIYNSMGELTITLVNDNLSAGTHSMTWNGTDGSGMRVSTGAYFVRLDFEKQPQVQKLLILR